MATRDGFESPTFGFGDQRSAGLNYRAIKLKQKIVFINIAMINLHSYTLYANQELLWVPSDSEDLYKENLSSQLHLLEEHNWLSTKFTYKFNTEGFRCQEFNSSNNMLALGCSLTFGLGLPLEETWPVILANKLGLTCYNLGIPGASNDTAFRLASHWIPLLKPSVVVLYSPAPDRLELVTDTKAYTYLPGKPNNNPGSEFYKMWITNSGNGKLNQEKNIGAIAHLCNSQSIKFVYVYGNELNKIDLARDLQHPGRLTNANYADLIMYKIMSKYVQNMVGPAGFEPTTFCV